MPRMLYFGVHRIITTQGLYACLRQAGTNPETRGGLSSATVRVSMPEVREENRKNRKRGGPASEEVSALRRESRTAAIRPGHPIQGLWLVRDGLRGQIER